MIGASAPAVSAACYRLYNAIWYPALPFALIAGGGDRRERMGRIEASAMALNGTPRLWFHAASVGEVEALAAVARGLIGELPGAAAIVTTMTETGRDAARRRIPEAAVHQLAPLDHPAAVRHFVAAVRPALVVIAETELWPGYFVEARRAGARIAIVNGRVSEHSFERYQWLRPLFAAALGETDLVLAQTVADARRYRALGAPRRRLIVTGNTKFDLARLAPPPALRSELARFADAGPTLIAGSTAPGEEAIVLAAWQRLAQRFPDLRLALAPRHLDRIGAVEQLIRDGAGAPYLKASTAADAVDESARVLLVNTMGELSALYQHAAIAFVGGSLVPGRGGQSLAEPAAAGVPVLFGPFHENQRPMANALLSGDGGRVVTDERTLYEACAALLDDEGRRREAGRAARRSLELMGGAVGATIPLLKALLLSR